MKAVLRAVNNWYVVTGVLTLLIALFLLLVGPLIAVGPVRPFAPWWGQLIAQLLLFGGVGALAYFRWQGAKKNADALAASLAKAEAGNQEAAVVAKRMKEALGKLKTIDGKTGNYLYDKPWYVIIGPPGAGKTTALKASGLRFPLSDSAAQAEPFQGVGGTRNTDWMFADEAVIVDTAGRYTSQDSDAARDEKGWTSFLKLLKTHRPRQPINGVFVALGMDDILSGDRAVLERHAGAVRARMKEIVTTLEVTPPVYVLFTKSDLIPGFTEFFDDRTAEGRREALGTTFEWDGPRAVGQNEVLAAFDELASSLTDRLGARLNDEADPRRRALVLGFPTHFMDARKRAAFFLETAFGPSDFDAPQAFRGFYFVSGVQHGAPIDRLIGSVAAVTGLTAAAGGAGRAYFINKPLREVAFDEAGLVTTSPKAERRRILTIAGAYGLCAAVLIAFAVMWWGAQSRGKALTADLSGELAGYKADLAASGLNLAEASSDDVDLLRAKPLLDRLQTMPAGYAQRRDEAVDTDRSWGIDPRPRVSPAAESAYQAVLQRTMLPRVFLRTEQQLRLALAQGRTDAIYAPLKAYLMLSGRREIQPETVKAWVTQDWRESQYPGLNYRETRDGLETHLDALLESLAFTTPWDADGAPVDPTVIEQAQQRLLSVPVAEQLLRDMQAEAEALGERGWVLGDVLTSQNLEAFALTPQGQELAELNVPFLYTKQGFFEFYLPILEASRALAENEIWVLGEYKDYPQIQEQLRTLKGDFSSAYAEAYVRHWRGVVRSLTPASFADPNADSGALVALSAEPSPLTLILSAVRENTALAEASEIAAAAAASEGADQGGIIAGVVGERLVESFETRSSLVREARTLQRRTDLAAARGPQGGAGLADEPADAAKIIEARMRDVHQYVGDGSQPGAVDTLVARLRDFRNAASNAAVLRRGAADPSQIALAQQALDANALRLGEALRQAPGDLGGFVSQVGVFAQANAASTHASGVAGRYAAELRPICEAVVTSGGSASLYPFNTRARTDASPSDVARLFGPNDGFDRFKTQALQGLLTFENNRLVWRDSPRTRAFTDDSARAFKKAEEIRAALGLNAGAPGFSLQVRGVSFGGGVTSAELDLGGGPVAFEPAQTGARQTQWSSVGAQTASLSMKFGEAEIARETGSGPWSLFRLIQQGRVDRLGAGRINVTWGSGQAFVTLELAAQTLGDPFARDAFAFTCPAAL